MRDEVCAAIVDAACIWLGEPHDLVEKSCFTGAVVPSEGRDLPGVKAHTNIAIGCGGTEGFGEVINGECGRGVCTHKVPYLLQDTDGTSSITAVFGAPVTFVRGTAGACHHTNNLVPA